MIHTAIFNSSRIARHAVVKEARTTFLPQATIEKSTTEYKIKNNYNFKNSYDLPKLLNANKIIMFGSLSTQMPHKL